MKLLLVFNSAPHYRESIYRLIDSSFDCEYVFGKNSGDIKQMDTSLLKGNVERIDNKYLVGRFYWQKGVQKYLRKEYDTFIILGDSRCLSSWLFCIRARLFLPKKRVFFWTHGWYGKEGRIEKILKKLFFRLPNGGIFLYGNYAKQLMVQEGFDSSKLYVIHNSLAYERQLIIRQSLCKEDVLSGHFGNEFPNLLFVGRLTKVKHLDLILLSMRILMRRGKKYNLVLIGSGEQQEKLQAIARQYGLESNVWFYGPCYNEEQIGRLIYNADLCVSPGNVGLTAIHSMVYGTPVLTHNDFSWQMPEFESIKEGETGGFFDRDSVESLAKAIDGWFEEKGGKRDEVRMACFHEIDTQWNPQFQLNVLKEHLL